MREVEQAQRAQYMADYESTAFMSLERLKEQHGEELSNFQELIRCLAVETASEISWLLVE
eukprot:Skav228821  [mRNA]  locus=scaffold359:456054:456710:+ [translate_table: standard]